MSDEIQSVTTETAAPTTTDVPAPEPVKETFDETLDRVAREVTTGGLRDEQGRFQGRAGAANATPAVEVPGSSTAAPPEPALPAIEAPQSLPADVKAKWSTLPPDVQKVWAERESEAHKKITTDGERLKSLSAFEEVLKPFESRLQQVQAPPAEYVRRLASADQMLASNFEQGIQEIYRLYGRDPRAAVHPGQQPDPNSALISKITELETRLRERETADEQSRLNAATQQIEQFKKDRPHFDDAVDLMDKFIRSGVAKGLDDAYDMAINASPEIRAKREAAAKAEADKKAAEEAKARAAKDAKIVPLAKRPGSTPTAPIKGTSWEQTVDRVAKEVASRA